MPPSATKDRFYKTTKFLGNSNPKADRRIPKNELWDKPHLSDASRETNILALYHETPENLKGITRTKDDARDLLALDPETLADFKSLMEFLFSQHQGLLRLNNVKTVASKLLLCDVCNKFLDFLTPKSTRSLLDVHFSGDRNIENSHLRGWLLFQLALDIRTHTLNRLKKEPKWLGPIPNSVYVAFANGLAPDMDLIRPKGVEDQIEGILSGKNFGAFSTTRINASDSALNANMKVDYLDIDLIQPKNDIMSNQKKSLGKHHGKSPQGPIFEDNPSERSSLKVPRKLSFYSRVGFLIFFALVLFTVTQILGGPRHHETDASRLGEIDFPRVIFQFNYLGTQELHNLDMELTFDQQTSTPQSGIYRQMDFCRIQWGGPENLR
ncbi:hypothetical protein EYR41_005754 [Orbilia oligospora]|uniref:Uncharacterized protein n=1 Tax=Orbilia oligospora TaxID=2813651 RepID=A0A7C8PJP4_ORBOL|nr:hypothetical protein TWF751_007099 [Orbilia oligospora]TGJ69735.1 hypothetical protein EYR41_005754 [Orbilia oligospora]